MTDSVTTPTTATPSANSTSSSVTAELIQCTNNELNHLMEGLQSVLDEGTDTITNES